MKIGSIKQAISYLESFIPDLSVKTAGKIGFERMKLFAEALGNPQNEYPTIHVAGTSGKGSTATFIASILGIKYKTGLHTSPHLAKINERIKIICKGEGGREKGKEIYVRDITDLDFIDILNSMIPPIDDMRKTVLGPPSYFEITTALAFLYFKIKKVDIAVIEVGLGGRWDATNIIKPEIAVITNIGLDHTQILGNTVEKIAAEKAGIIKEGIEVVTGAKQESVINIIKSKIPTSARPPGLRGACKNSFLIKSSAPGIPKLSLLGRDFGYQIKEMNQN
jgi:dihydrofolate synthase / folylpolyglutamate synthase